jgi:hypothetical protein
VTAPTALLGLDGLIVGAHELIDGEWWLLVETTADVVGCPSCGARAIGHGRRLVHMRDVPISGRPTRLLFRERLWCCADPECEMRTWSETHPAIASRAALTQRGKEMICLRVGRGGHGVAAVAAEFGVGWHAAMAAVIEISPREEPAAVCL